MFCSCKVIRFPEFGKFLLMESVIPGFGIRNSKCDWNPESKFHRHRIRVHGLESRFHDCLGSLYMRRYVTKEKITV